MAPRKKTLTPVEAIHQGFGIPEKQNGALGAAAAEAGAGFPAPPPASSEAMAKMQLRRIVNQYEAMTEDIVSTTLRCSAYRNHETGEVSPSPLSAEQRAAFLLIRDATKKARQLLVPEMVRLMRAYPVYNVYLAHVRGVGPVTAAKLLADIDIKRSIKVSALHRLCGLAVRRDPVTGKGKAQRAVAGMKLDYHQRLKTGLYQAFSSLTKDAKREESAYWKRLVEYKQRLQNCYRLDYSTEPPTPVLDENGNQKKRFEQVPGADKFTFDGRPGGKAIVNNMAWRAGAQLLIEDLYIVWRTVEGLDVWPSYQAGKLGFAHGGKVVVNVGKRLTLEEALAAVGMPTANAIHAQDHLKAAIKPPAQQVVVDEDAVVDEAEADNLDPNAPVAAAPPPPPAKKRGRPKKVVAAPEATAPAAEPQGEVERAMAFAKGTKPAGRPRKTPPQPSAELSHGPPAGPAGSLTTEPSWLTSRHCD